MGGVLRVTVSHMPWPLPWSLPDEVLLQVFKPYGGNKVFVLERTSCMVAYIFFLPDEDITCSDITTLATFDSQVKQFFIMIVFDTFDELMLHHDVCSFSFLELHTWIKERFDCIWKAWKVNEVDWGPNPSIPNVLH